MAVVGVPKTIDNDILLMDKTFGFDTAVEEAQRAINSAYIEVQNWFHLLLWLYKHCNITFISLIFISIYNLIPGIQRYMFD